MRVLHVDSNHDVLAQGLSELGCINDFDYESSREEIMNKMADYEGLIIRSRFTIDKEFIDASPNLKFIGRVGAGLENIYLDYAEAKGIIPVAAPEGNRGAVGEHSLGMLLNLFNRINLADREVRQGLWRREANRGVELDGKCVGLIGYGNMGKSFAKRLRGFDCEVVFYDLNKEQADHNATFVSLEDLQKKADVISIHTPQTPLTMGMIDKSFLEACKKNIYLINTARGSAVKTADLVDALESGKVLGAGLDVLEYEKKSFEDFFKDREIPEDFKKLIASDRVILSPHVAGWTIESKFKLAQTIVNKVATLFFNKTSKAEDNGSGVTGIGGLFFKAIDPDALKQWYRDALNFNIDQWGATFWWEDKQGKPASTQWSVFKNDNTYMLPSKKDFMFNYRVANLEATLAHLKTMEIHPLEPTQEFNYGKFSWIMDPEGNKIELWEANDLAFI